MVRPDATETERNLLLEQRRVYQAKRRVRAFERQYDRETLKLACYGAFPLTLTSDLLYCLRENFVPDCHWYAVGDVLLSGLCEPLGRDLYGMEGETRQALLARLEEEEGETAFAHLQNFMVKYLEYRLGLEKSGKERLRLVAGRPEWTALACLQPDKVVEAIRQELQRLAEDGDPQERFQMAALVEDYADLLLAKGFRPTLLELARKTEAGEAIEEDLEDPAEALARALGVELDWLEVEAARSGAGEVGEDNLISFTFETAQVDQWGNVRRGRGEAYLFREPLGDAAELLEMVAIVGGSFQMGSPTDESGHNSREGPQHEVRVASFFMGRYPVTQVQWKFVAGLPPVNRELELAPEPSNFKGGDRPVESITWYEAVEFCDRLSAYTGRPYRLPSEAEWEYACRVGTTTPFHFGETITTDLANYRGTDREEYGWSGSYGEGPKGEYREETTPVQQFGIANGFGLCGMHGNVFEWCADHWHDSYEGAPEDGSAWLSDKDDTSRVIRGGSWDVNPRGCRSACRLNHDPGDRVRNFGFRVVCSPPQA